MNVFREIRKINNKSPVRKFKIIVILILYVLLISSTYAWYVMLHNVNVGTLKGSVESWDTIYKYDNEMIDQIVTFNINDFYPGKNYSKTIYIYNMGEHTTYLEVELLDISIFGQSQNTYVSSNNGISFPCKNNSVNLFGTNDYPFEINYTLNKSLIYTKYNEDNPLSTPDAVATLRFNLNWDYEVENEHGVDNNTNIRDTIDTTLGNTVYNYITNNTTTEEEKKNIIEVTLRLTGERYYEEDDTN